MSNEEPEYEPEHAAPEDSALVLEIRQIVDGDYTCHCGAPAVLSLFSEPDAEPGTVCAEHGFAWISSTVHLLQALFGPGKSAPATDG